MELTEREAHCVARLLQGARYGDNFLSGCTFCKYPCYGGEKITPRPQEILDKFQKATGVDLKNEYNGQLPYSRFPYGKFLVNSNDGVKGAFEKVLDFANQLS